MPLKVDGHAADRFLRQVRTVRQVARARDAHFGHAALALWLLAADLKRALRVASHRLWRLRVDVGDGLRSCIAHGNRDGDRLVARVALVEKLRNLLGDAVGGARLLFDRAERVHRILQRLHADICDGLVHGCRCLPATVRPGGAGGRGRRLRGEGRDSRRRRDGTAERLVVEQQGIRVRVIAYGEPLQLARLVDRHHASGDGGADALKLKALILENGIVVRQERVVLNAEERQKRLIQRLLVHSQERQDRVRPPRRKADLRGREVRVIGLEHRDRHAEYRGDLLDDLRAACQFLRREAHRLEVDIGRHREEAARALFASQLLVNLDLEPLDLVRIGNALERQQVVGPRLVGEERKVHLMHGLVLHRRAPCGFCLAEPVVQVARVRPPEVNHLVGGEEAPLIAGRAIEIAVDELDLSRHDLDPLRRHDPQRRRATELAVDDGMNVRVARQLRI